MRNPTHQRPACGGPAIRNPKPAFTLVELLVVIAIIGILAALIIAAAGPAVVAAKRNAIKAVIEQFNVAFEDYKNNVGSYPPNTQTDGAAGPLVESDVLSNFKRHFNKAFPQNREPPELIAGLVGLNPNGTASSVSPGSGGPVLPGGMTAAEALVFWVGGFSDDPKFPISGPGGPSYLGDQANQDQPNARSWRLDVNEQSLAPRDANGYFPADYVRYITYPDPRDSSVTRRINFWQIDSDNPATPYLYFDASRGSGVEATIDPPAATEAAADSRLYDQLRYVYAIKQTQQSAAATKPYRFANDGKFQILHGGTGEAWLDPSPGETLSAFPMVDENDVTRLVSPKDESTALSLLFPAGPWTGDLADTLTNFTPSTLEDAQP